MQIPFVDLQAQYQSLNAELDAAVLRVMQQCNFILGKEVSDFERAFAAYVGAKHCVGVASGLDALKLALEALGIGCGDEVIIPAHTFIASALAVSASGARPVLVEVEEDSFNLDPRRLEAAITPRAKAIMPVHLYGQPADLEPVLDIARRYGLRVIEDASQAHGARYRGRRVGAFGDAGCFSFYPGKNLGAYGDAGGLVTDDDALAERARLLRNYGQEVKYKHVVKGYNLRLDTMQAAVLGVKLPRLDDWNARRSALAATYTHALEGVGDLKLPRVVHGDHVFHLYVVRTARRDALQRHLAERGIATVIHYPMPIHLQAAYADLGYGRGAFPLSERLADEVLSLPIYAELTTEQQSQVIAAVKDFFA
ncbi:MAG: erythromycin biosynthesis sensory transduction protein eryC1 [Chloracidobacterium sp. CP2_5A]|nr:MAG: erythromycin biosynthesis sensory transduction protein eryC1 [Chloracidobacterium sp. CP2_5A]